MKRSTLLSILAVLFLGAAVFVMRQWNEGANRDAAEEMEIDEPSVSPGHEASGTAASPGATPAREPASAPSVAPSGAPSSGPLEDPLQEQQDSAIAALQSTSKVPWQVRRDDLTRSIRTLALGRRAMSAESGEATAAGVSARAAADQFIEEYSQPLFGVAKDQLLFTEETMSDRTRVTYRQVIAGTEVYGATLNLFFENGDLTRVQNDLSSLKLSSRQSSKTSGSHTSLTASLEQAFEAYRKLDVSVKSELNPSATSRPVLYPGTSALVQAYEFSVKEVSSETGEGTSSRVLYNLEDGTLIRKWSTIIH